MKADTIQKAWNLVNEFFPTDYEKDEASSQRAGYPIYRSTTEGHYYDYICDLGNRLEVNLSSGKTVNIWIQPEEQDTAPAAPAGPELPAMEDIKKAAAHQHTFEPEQMQLIRVFADGYQHESEASRAVYRAMRSCEPWWQRQIASDMAAAYCEDKGIEWGRIRVISVQHYGGETEGHYVIEAIVWPRAKE